MKKKNYDIITCGSATVDVFVKTRTRLIDLKQANKSNKEIKHFIGYPTGEKILINHIEFMIGGGGTNTSVSFSRLGLKTGYLGKIAEDINGKKILKVLQKEKVDFLGAIAKKNNHLSGYSVVLDSKADDRTILTYKGTNNELKYSELDRGRLITRWFYFSSMVGTSFKTLERLAAFAKQNKIKIAFNPSNYQAASGKTYLKKILDNTDVLILNKEEAELLLKSKTKDIKSLIIRLLECGPKIAVITDGKRGAYCSEGINLYHVRPRKVKILETTGAGDAFASGFIAGLIKRQDIGLALDIGMTNAQSVIKHYGAKNKLLGFNEAMKILNKDPAIIKKVSL